MSQDYGGPEDRDEGFCPHGELPNPKDPCPDQTAKPPRMPPGSDPRSGDLIEKRRRVYPKPDREAQTAKTRPWRLDCDLAYDGGGSQWSKGYRTYLGARIAAWYHYRFGSWGGTIDIVDQRGPLL